MVGGWVGVGCGRENKDTEGQRINREVFMFILESGGQSGL